MKYKKLGNTGLLVSELSLGAMTFGGAAGWEAVGQLQQDAVNELMGRALDAGINLIDTANVYSNGLSETLLGQSLKDLQVRRDSVVIATKVTSPMGTGPNDAGLSRQHIFTQVKASLQRLQTDYIDLYQIHAADDLTPMEETLDALNDLVKSGLVRYTGCSNLRAWQIMKAKALSRQHGWAGFESLQAFYAVAGRDIEREIVPALKDQQMGLLVWSPLAGGLLSGKFRKGKAQPETARRTHFNFPPINMDYAYSIIDTMAAIAEAHKASVARVALAWLLAKPHVTSVIIGAKNMQQLDDNLAAAGLTLSPEELQQLDAVSALTPEYPDWVPLQAFRAGFLEGKPAPSLFDSFK